MNFEQKLKEMKSTLETVLETTKNQNINQDTEVLYDNMKKVSKAYTYLLEDYKLYFKLKKQLKDCEKISIQLSQLLKLNSKQKERIAELISQLEEIKQEKELLRKEINRYDKSNNKVGIHEEEIQEKLKEIIDTAQNRELYQSKINILERDIDGILYEREELGEKLNRIYYVSIALVIIFSLIIFGLITMASLWKLDILFISAICTIFLIFVGTYLYISRRNALYELKKIGLQEQQMRKQIKKDKIKLFNFAHYLQYQYKKYKVKDAKMLEEQYVEYKSYKRKTEKYKTLTRQQTSMENLILRVLKEVGIEDFSFIDKGFNLILDIEMQQKKSNIIKNKITDLKEKILEMEEEKKVIDQFLNEKVKEYSQNPILKKMIIQYEKELREIEISLDKTDSFI